MGFTIETHDCSHKFLDDTKTCVELFLEDYFGNKTSVVHAFTAETEEEVTERKDYYIDFLLNHIKKNTKWV